MKNTLSNQIISCLPYDDSFIFVQSIEDINLDSVIAKYSFKSTTDFYKWHFKHLPVTPGILITEMMGQAGPIAHLIFLEKIYESKKLFHPIVTNITANFLNVIQPDSELTIKSKKLYYRKNIICSEVSVFNLHYELCAKSELQVKLILD
jgi:3-hydroxyacyl-[acyl-carrier-protein] dehydratase